MKKLTKKQARRMCKALDYALERVKEGEVTGLCSGLVDAWLESVTTHEESDYLDKWISRQLGGHRFLESWVRGPGFELPGCGLTRYDLRKPWVEWMKKHLMETAT